MEPPSDERPLELMDKEVEALPSLVESLLHSVNESPRFLPGVVILQESMCKKIIDQLVVVNTA